MSKSSAATIEVIDRFQAAKMFKIDCWAVYEAIEAKRLTPVGKGKRGEDVVSKASVESWLATLTPAEAATVYACTRKGCYAAIDRHRHIPSQVADDGTITHGNWLFDGRPTDAKGRLTDPRPLTTWDIYLRARGNEPWEIEIQAGILRDAAPKAIRSASAAGDIHLMFELPKTDYFIESLAKAIAKRDKLNAELAKNTTTERN